MTLFEPSLFIRRLLVSRDAKTVLDVSFHRGINVVTGENSAGKTTLIRFLAFALGSENIEFNKIALLCSTALCEVEANGAVVTLRREVSDKSQTGMSIYWGPIDDAITAGLNEWQFFPFRRSESKLSFSQILFGSLGLPELRGESGSNITMHQILRMVYSDQETPGAELFRAERFDSPITRQAIGEFLLGVDDNELYELQLRAGTLEKEDSAIGSALRAVYGALGKAGASISLEFVESRLIELAGELENNRKKLEKKRIIEDMNTGKASVEDDQLRDQLTQSLRNLSALKDKRLDIIKQIADSELFLIELQDRIESIEDSQDAASYLGTVQFSICPCCLGDISSRVPKENLCSLCSAPIDGSVAKTQLARMRSELSLQFRESGIVKAELVDQLTTTEREIAAHSSLLVSLENQFRTSKATWRTNADIERESILTRVGSLEQELKQLVEFRKLAKSLDEQHQKRAELAAELAKLRDRIAAVREQQKNRRLDAYEAVARHLKIFLQGDIPRAQEFANPRDVSFDFGSNRITIDLQQQFSASSMVYLRHAFRLALLFASLEKTYFRYPRLVIIDGIEDGGMEPERSYNFQELILRVSASQKVDHQIILTTSSIAAALDLPELLAGRKYTHDQRSVAILE